MELPSRRCPARVFLGEVGGPSGAALTCATRSTWAPSTRALRVVRREPHVCVLRSCVPDVPAVLGGEMYHLCPPCPPARSGLLAFSATVSCSAPWGSCGQVTASERPLPNGNGLVCRGVQRPLAWELCVRTARGTQKRSRFLFPQKQFHSVRSHSHPHRATARHMGSATTPDSGEGERHTSGHGHLGLDQPLSTVLPSCPLPSPPTLPSDFKRVGAYLHGRALDSRRGRVLWGTVSV